MYTRQFIIFLLILLPLSHSLFLDNLLIVDKENKLTTEQDETTKENKPEEEQFNLINNSKTTKEQKKIETAEENKPAKEQFNLINNSKTMKEQSKIESTKNGPVKLTMKQGLIMNQILSVYALSNVEDPLCRNHTNEFNTGLRRMEPWALKMFDSSSKLQAGILSGNLFEFGAYTQCLNIEHHTRNDGPIYGKSCTIQVKPPLKIIKKILSYRNVSNVRFKKIKLMVEKAMLSWSVCVPHSCPEEDIFRHFNKNIIDLTEGLNFEVILNKNHCSTIRSESQNLDVMEIVTFFILGIFVATVVVCSLVEYSNKKAAQNFIVSSFSGISNFKRIIAPGGEPSIINLECLHGIRFLSTCYVVFGHRYLMAMFFPVVNSLEILDWTLKYSSTIIIGGTVCVDTFFLVSAVLVSVKFFEYVTETNQFNLIWFYMYRYLRITLPLAIVVLVYATFIQRLGSGPLWYDTYKSIQLPCQYYWWSTLLHIQNYINPDAICVLQTWSLSADMPFYYISPIILYPLWKWPKFGLVNFAFIYLLSLLVSFYLAWVNEYEGSMPVTNQLLETKYFQRHYVAPHARISPYLIGLGLGYALFKHRNSKLKIGIFIKNLGWVTSITLLLIVIIGCHNFQVEDHPYNRFESSIFLACSRSAWVLGLSWIILTCSKGHGGSRNRRVEAIQLADKEKFILVVSHMVYIVGSLFLKLSIINDILSSLLFRVLGRISYGIFLLHLLLQFLKSGATKGPFYFSDFTTLYDASADLFFMLVAGFFFTIFYELPLVRLQSFFFRTKQKTSKVTPQGKPMNSLN